MEKVPQQEFFLHTTAILSLFDPLTILQQEIRQMNSDKNNCSFSVETNRGMSI